jgi:hypothetical protein
VAPRVAVAYRARVSATDLQFDPFDPADAGESVRFAMFAGNSRVAVWPDVPNQAEVKHPALAPVVFVDDTGALYAERIPLGIRLLDAEPPHELSRYIVSQVLRALAALHAQNLHHGDVDDAHVMLGLDGQVVLFGTGRGPGAPNTDVLAAMDLLPAGADITVPSVDASANAARMEDSLAPGARARLSGWVRTLGAAVGRFDEVIRDVGPENDSTGLLDRYETDAQNLDDDELPDEDSSTQMNAGSALWRTLAAPPLNKAPNIRFDSVMGVPSRAVQHLLATERLMRVDVPAVGPVEPFVVDASPTIERDDESSHTTLMPTAELLKAKIESRRGILADTLTPQPKDRLLATPVGASQARQPSSAGTSEISTGFLVSLVVGTVAVVVFGLWFMGLIG